MSSGDLIRVDPDPHTGESIGIDDTAWPRVVLRWPGGERSDDELVAAANALRALGARGETYTLLVDAREARPPTRAQLGMMLALARRFGPGVRCVATAIVSRSSIVRASIDSVRWMYLTPSRCTHFDELGAAMRWLDRAALERDALAPRARSARAGADHRPGSIPPPPS